MREVTIELEELVCKWLDHISEVTGKPVEEIIVNGIYNHMSAIEGSVHKAFLGFN